MLLSGKERPVSSQAICDKYSRAIAFSNIVSCREQVIGGRITYISKQYEILDD